MKKPLATRIAALAVIYCIVFFLLVVLQFSNKGSFSLSVGSMTIRGRYKDIPNPIETSAFESDTIAVLNDDDTLSTEVSSDITEDTSEGAYIENEYSTIQVTGGIRIYFGGLEFSLNEVRGKGLTLISSGRQYPINPEYVILSGTTARFGLPDGTVLSFTSLSNDRNQELIINCEFSDNATEVIIPITPRRSSIVRDENRLGIMYTGSRYLFASAGLELEEGRIVLSRDNSMVSYRSRAKQRAFDPSNFIIAQANNYESAYINWKEESYIKWNQHPAALQDEFDIMGYLTEALDRRNYTAAVNSISREFTSSNRHSFRSASFLGGMANAHRTFLAAESSKMNTINSLVRERSTALLIEEHVLDYLFIRSSTALAYDVVDIIQNLMPEMITIDLIPGLLESSIDLKRWRPAANNPIEVLHDHILTIIGESLVHDTEKDLVLVSNSEGISNEFNARLGKALMEWANQNQDTEWLAIGKSLVLSALISEGSGAGRLYNIINQETYYPKTVWLMDSGLWAWTAASGVRAVNVGTDINISFTFPVNMTHHVIIRGVKPFTRIQIHDTDWRTDSQYERYDASGWVYYPQDQILLLKLKHSETVENVRIIYRAAAPAPAPAPEPAEGENAE